MVNNMENDKIKYTTYTASAMEHTDLNGMCSWRKEFSSYFAHLKPTELFIYHPTDMEAVKVGKEPGEHIKYTSGLKRAGHFDLFFDNMSKIYFGEVDTLSTLPINIITAWRMEKIINGNYLNQVIKWGDIEAVIRCDFLTVKLEKDTKTVGTYFEYFVASVFNIPIYLIVDETKTNTNSSVIYFNMLANRKLLKIFNTVKECAEAIKEDYKLMEKK